jgi:homogentisate 1,2-dioxygenase
MFYVSEGSVPHKRHTQHRAPDGGLYSEELFGVEGFVGRSSLLYHVEPPTRTHRIEAGPAIVIEGADDGLHRHRLVKTGPLTARGDALSGRIPLFYNSDVTMGVCLPAEAMAPDSFYRNGEGDEMLYVHTGEGVLETVFGDLRYGPGDYLVLPIGTTWRLAPDAGSDQRMLWLECPSELEPPKRYRNDYGQLLEHSPYSQRDIRTPVFRPPNASTGEFRVAVKAGGRLTNYFYASHPFDVVGWDGYLWPYAFNIADFEPITGRVHQPPPVHQTFQGHNFVVCSFVPRKFDYHPLSIPAPYNHSNINSDEVIYYVAGNFMSRRGVDIASFTVHPAGIPHGPHPGTVEASIGKERTEELAVMVDTFRSLRITRQAAELDDGRYPYSWLPPEPGSDEASRLVERGPEAFPD